MLGPTCRQPTAGAVNVRISMADKIHRHLMRASIIAPIGYLAPSSVLSLLNVEIIPKFPEYDWSIPKLSRVLLEHALRRMK